jgi:hypothetical protein
MLGERINEMTRPLDPEVQMRAGREAARSYAPDYLAHPHPPSGPESACDVRKMAVQADYAVRVTQLNASSELPTPSRHLDSTTRYRMDRRSIASREIDAQVRSVDVQNRVEAMVTESRRDVAKSDREAQRPHMAKLYALGIEQVRPSTAVAESEGAQNVAPIFDLRGLHAGY